MKRLNSGFVLLVLLVLSVQLQAANPVYKNPKAPLESRVKDLVGRMTLEEKVLQLVQKTAGSNTNPNNFGEKVGVLPAGIGSIIFYQANPEVRNLFQKRAMEETRLGIPMLFAQDVIHGYRTIYPISLGQACSWNTNLVEQAAAVAARESKLSGLDWTFSPMVDVARDPRWGRVAEGYGEEPYANAAFGVATIHGYQGKNLKDSFSIAACLKHYVAYGASESGQDYRYTEVSNQTLWNVYLPSFEAGIKAGAATVMSAFNDLSGVPTSGNYYTLTEILKKRWKHDGFVVSDWGAVEQLIYQGYAKDSVDATLKALMAGVEVDMCDDHYKNHLAKLVKEKKIPMSVVDDAVSRVLRLKFRLGLFENPYAPVIPMEERYVRPQDVEVARQLAEETMVLLKNKDNVLPIRNKERFKIAVMGPVAKDQPALLGSWSMAGRAADVETLFDGISKEFDKSEVKYVLGTNFDMTNGPQVNEAQELAKWADVVVLCMGEHKHWSGENASYSNIEMNPVQEEFIKTIKNSGKRIILVLSSGRPLGLQKVEPLVDAIVAIWQPGIAGGTPLAGILSGRINPSGKLSITFPLSTGQIPVYKGMRQSARYFHGMNGNFKDIGSKPLYEFGHGLSYTTYNYAKPVVSKTKFRKGDRINLSVDVSNTGNMDGKEAVLWFVSDPVSTISRPPFELRHFDKKLIKKGETVKYSFDIDPIKDLSYRNEDGKVLLEKGDYFIHVGNHKVKLELVD